MDAVQKANQYIREKRTEVVDEYRNHFHLMAPVGWINDPNGFIYFRGEYHLFYQFYPYDSVWGPMHWGHAKSKDLLHWEELPVALAPGESYDKDGCFSGSAIEKDGKLYLMYTGHTVVGEQVRQVQCLAVSEDGIVFKKYAQNPIIAEEHIADVAQIDDFRDPKVFQREGHFYSVVAAKTAESRGQILLFESEDLLEWQFSSVLLEGDDEQGVMWECPDLFHLDGKDVLILSPIEMDKKGLSYWNTSSTVAFIGAVDWQTGRFIVENHHEIDHGVDFYAPQTCLGKEDKRIMVAWMQMWHRTMPTHDLGHKWSGSMTLPRELFVEKNRLLQRPIQTLYQSLDITLQKENLELSEQPIILEKVISDQTYAALSIAMNDAQEVALLFGHGGNTLEFHYSAEESLVTVSRKNSGWKISGNEEETYDFRCMRVPLVDGKLKVEIVRDTSSMEWFFNDSTAMSFTFYEKSKGHDLMLSASDRAVLTSIKIGEIQ
ncbi:glycoside hydrolase family 32 protein [Candidatus Enterococcus clewellii]|uniref:Sucrose-6-phosphate hydrolase n=1 Tax=Candidatus Enterococcus clewellii TaxID=1834193 RepID=A0A242K1H5_9ENTE|nr:glycoside hydrolase family 32 protein [Enterococcus sp. 9E7_DIV0242]OTP11511.1 hypothetical protein A5888_003610 [Enterococcus sp. 9E7_DIV0242]